jgi:hypothetical protein
MARSKCKLNRKSVFNLLVYVAALALSVTVVFFLLKNLFFSVTKNVEGLAPLVATKTGLVDFVNADPNIHATPVPKPPDACGGLAFLSAANSGISVIPQSKTYLHSSVKACEVECTPDRSCFGVSFDTKSKDHMKKCTLYSGAPANASGSIKAATICSRAPPKCSKYKVDADTNDLGNIIKYSDKQSYFIHSNEGACEAECTKNNSCVGMLYDESSPVGFGKKCWLFSQAESGKPGFPLRAVCSRPAPTKPAPTKPASTKPAPTKPAPTNGGQRQ